MSKSWRGLAAFALLLAIVAVVAGCGSGGGSSSNSEESTTAAPTETETGSTSEAGSGAKAEAEEFVAEHSDMEAMEWPQPPDEPYNPGKGKIGIVSCSSTASGCVEMSKEAEKAAAAAGWEATEPLDGKFTPSVQSGLINQLVAEKVDAIALITVQPETVSSAIHAALEAGIPVTDVYTPKDKDSTGVTLITQDGIETGEYIGTYIAAHAAGKTRVDIAGDDPAFPILVERTEGVESSLEKFCPECEVHVTHVSGEELAKPGPPAFAALLSSNPMGTLEWVVGGPADPFGEPMLKTAEQQGRTDIKWFGVDSSPAVLENMAAGGIVQADTFSAYRYAGWAAVEQAIRQVAGLKPWPAENLPIAYITNENVSEALSTLPLRYTPLSFDYEQKFKELWSGK